jgi:hypothetical protein
MREIIDLIKFLAVLVLKIFGLCLCLGAVLLFSNISRVIQGLGMLLLGVQLALYGSQWGRSLTNQQTPSAMHDPHGYNEYQSGMAFSALMALAGIGFIIWGIVMLVSELVASITK